MNNEAKNLAEWVKTDFDHARANRKDIERKWQRNHDAFHKIANGEWKPFKTGEGEDWRSDAFLDYTRQKVIAFLALVIDVLLSGGKFPFMLVQDHGYDDPGDMAPEVEQAIEYLSRRIDTQLERTRAERELVRCALSLGEYGVCWAKDEAREIRTKVHVEIGLDGVSDTRSLPAELRRFKTETRSVDMPTFVHVSNWNMYWDQEVSDPHEMAYIFDEHYTHPEKLREMAGWLGVSEAAIEKAIKTAAESGTSQASNLNATSVDPKIRDISHRVRTIRQLTRWGLAPKRLVDKQLAEMAGEPFDEAKEYKPSQMTYCLIEMANDEVYRVLEANPEELTYDKCVAEEDIDSTAGRGVADNVEDDHKILQGSVRLLIDCKRLTANPVLAAKLGYFPHPEDLKTYTPGKIIEISDEVDDVRQALMQLQLSDVGESLMSLIQLVMRFGEENSLIPKDTVGLESGTSQTALEYSGRTEKAQKYTGLIVRSMDLDLIEPKLQYMVDYNMDDLEPEMQQILGRLRVKALGFSSFQARVVRQAGLMQLLQMVAEDSELRARWKLHDIVKEIVKSHDVDPAQFERPQEEVDADASRPDPVADAQADQAAAKAEEARARASLAQAQAAHKGAEIVKIGEQMKMDKAGAAAGAQARAQGKQGAKKNTPVDKLLEFA
ncbi:MAG: hypothetical protein ABFD89_06965 [Bryobacteraceae bacterium]